MRDNFDEENHAPDNEPAPTVGVKGVRYLSVKNSIKEDLQAIFELQKEVGQAIWTLHKLTASLNVGANAHNTAFVQAHEGLSEVLDSLTKRQDALQQRLNEVSGLSKDSIEALGTDFVELKNNFSTHQQLWSAELERITVAVDAVLQSHGYDPRTLAQRDPELTKELQRMKSVRERWMNAIIGTVVSLIAAGLLALYASTVTSGQQETHTATKEILKEMKNIADNVKKQQEALDSHIVDANPKKK